MCLAMRFSPEVEKKMIAKLPDGLITVYKTVEKRARRYRASLQGVAFKVGLNHADTVYTLGWAKSSYYKAGYHSFITVRGGHKWQTQLCCRGNHLVKYQIRKEWITAIGKQLGCIVYVTDRIISPSLRDKSAVVE